MGGIAGDLFLKLYLVILVSGKLACYSYDYEHNQLFIMDSVKGEN